jgi:ketosteroid isomerase-like protein
MSATAMSSGEKLELARRSYAAFSAGPDEQALIALYDPECQWSTGSAGAALGTSLFTGRDGVRSFARELGESMNELRLEIAESRITPAGRLLLRSHVSGRSSVNDMRLSTNVWQEVEFRDGLILRVAQLEEQPQGWETAEPID